MWQLVYTAPELPNPFEGAEVIPFPAARPSQPLRKPVSMTVSLNAASPQAPATKASMTVQRGGSQLDGVQLDGRAVEVEDDDEP